jgi:hypothetical protein
MAKAGDEAVHELLGGPEPRVDELENPGQLGHVSVYR